MLLQTPITYSTGAQATHAFPISATCDFATGKVQAQFGFWLDEDARNAGREPMERRAYEFDLAGAEAVLGAPLDLSGPVLALLAATLAD